MVVAVVDERVLRVRTGAAAGFAAAATRLVAAWLDLALGDALALAVLTGAGLEVVPVAELLSVVLGDDCTAGEASGAGVAGAVAAGGVTVVAAGSVGAGWAC